MATDKPVPAEQFDDMAQQRHANLLGMWTFLATELLLFGSLFASFLIFRVRYAEAFAGAASHLDLLLGSINTAVLLSSGLVMVLAESALERRRRLATLLCLGGVMLLGTLFLGIKGYEWWHEFGEGLMPVAGLAFEYPGAQPQRAELFFNFYFVMTGLHALHMLIGVLLLAVLAVLVARWRDPARLQRQGRVIGLYWAFVDVVWVFVFTLLYLLGS